jgi:hypothetical protein
MAISLKEQLLQVKRLNEISYTIPVFDRKFYNRMHDNSEDREAGLRIGRKMFYDFYAMELLYSMVGSGGRPKSEREKWRTLPHDDPSKDIIGSKGFPARHILNQSEIKVVDELYEKVTRAVAKQLVNYVHLAVVQEFQYFTTMSPGWTAFRQNLISIYNVNKSTITKTQFENAISIYIPEMRPYPDTVKRLLKYSKYINGPKASANDVADKIQTSTTPEPKAPVAPEPQTELPLTPSPDLSDEPTEPDDIDYTQEPVEVPPGADYDEEEPAEPGFKKDPSYSDEDDYWSPTPKHLTEGLVDTSIIKHVYSAMQKAGVTLDDIEKAYNYIPWASMYGGPKWGTGAIAMLKLLEARKIEEPEDLAHIIDHIYDLQHNTGSLLNKGPMYVEDEDLNRRFRITHIARFLPLVSPVVRMVILRYLKYSHGDPALEAQKEAILKSSASELAPEEAQKLIDAGFSPKNHGNTYKIDIKFVNKQKEKVPGVWYEFGKHGTKYVVSDNFKADIQVYDTFDEAFNYVMSYQPDFIKSGYNAGSSSGAAPTSPKAAPTSPKAAYIESHIKIKLSADREKILLDTCKMGWRPHKYYKAYFPGSRRFCMYAFSDGSFICAFQDHEEFAIYHEWDHALAHCEESTKDALPYPHTPTPETPTTPSVPAAPPTQGGFGVLPSGTFISELPPNAETTAMYTAHSGIDNPPKNTIRLTKEDEAKLAEIGFSPKKFSGQVWYLHNGTNDAVKFYPNNEAKLIFANNQATGVGIKKTIVDMINWLVGKYEQKTVQSPITAPTPSAAPHGGEKAGAMFEGILAKSGFSWDFASNSYKDAEGSAIIISPYPKSTLKIAGSSSHTFGHLPALATFLQKEFPELKKKVKKTEPSTQIKEKLAQLLAKGGFVKNNNPALSAPDGAATYANSSSDSVFIFPNNTAGAYDYEHKTNHVFDNLEELVEYMQEKYGMLHAPNTNTKNTALNVEEFNNIVNLASTWGKYFIVDEEVYPTPGGPVGSVKIKVEKNKILNPVFSITKDTQGRYHLYEPGQDNGGGNNSWEQLLEASSFEKLSNVIQLELKKYVTKHNPELLTGSAQGFVKNILTGTTGDQELDELLKDKGYSYEGVPIGHKFTMTFTNSYGSKLIIYNDNSTFVEWKNVNDVFSNTHVLDNFFELKSFLQSATTPPIVSGNVPQQAAESNVSLTPSNETYKTSKDEYNSDLIQLNAHDAQILENVGFAWDSTLKCYIKGTKTDDAATLFTPGTSAKFLSSGHAMVGSTGKTASFANIPNAIKFIVLTYMESPWSGQDYNQHPTDESLEKIKLNSQDHSLMELLGFEWDASSHRYSKALSLSISNVDLTEGKNSSIKDGFEIVSYWNSGNATWDLIKSVAGKVDSLNFKDGSISEILNFVWNRWKDAIKNTTVAVIATATPSNHDYNTIHTDKVQMAIPLNPSDTELLKKLGFKLTPAFGYPLYVRGMNVATKGYNQSFSAYNDNTSHYYSPSSDKNLYFHSVHDGIWYLIEQSSLKLPSAPDEEIAESLGLLGYEMNNNGLFEFDAGGVKKTIVTFFADGTVAVGCQNNNQQDLATFASFDEAYTMLKKHIKAHQIANKPHEFPGVRADYNAVLLIKQMGFVWDSGVGAYVRNWNSKLWQAIVYRDKEKYSYFYPVDADASYHKCFNATSLGAILNKIKVTASFEKSTIPQAIKSNVSTSIPSEQEIDEVMSKNGYIKKSGHVGNELDPFIYGNDLEYVNMTKIFRITIYKVGNASASIRILYDYRYISNPKTGELDWIREEFKSWDNFKAFIDGVMVVPSTPKKNIKVPKVIPHPSVKTIPSVETEPLLESSYKTYMTKFLK